MDQKSVLQDGQHRPLGGEEAHELTSKLHEVEGLRAGLAQLAAEVSATTTPIFARIRRGGQLKPAHKRRLATFAKLRGVTLDEVIAEVKRAPEASIATLARDWIEEDFARKNPLVGPVDPMASALTP